MHRFFIHPADICGSQGILKGTDVKHISLVLRLKKGDRVILSDGQGLEYEGVLEGEIPDGLLFSLSKPRPSVQESPLPIHLYQALIRTKPFDLLIQKTTELGVASITPVLTKRSIVSLPESRKKRRGLRWKKIAIEAAKQSQRALVPEIGDLLSFSEAIEKTSGTQGILPTLHSTIERRPISLPEGLGVSLFIGPEGGFTLEEVELAYERGFLPITLGPRILRSETAAVAGVAIISYLFGDGGGRDEGREKGCL